MSPEQRLAFHQAQSRQLMGLLEEWIQQQIDEHKVEPNSGLGEAISYMQAHWLKLTLFLREPGAPLDNDICERALKKAILHRNYADARIMQSRHSECGRPLLRALAFAEESRFGYSA